MGNNISVPCQLKEIFVQVLRESDVKTDAGVQEIYWRKRLREEEGRKLIVGRSVRACGKCKHGD